jgi:hypothetical protein
MRKGDKLKGALSREPSNKRIRVSPGVYRSPTNNRGSTRRQYMEGRRQQQPMQPAPSNPSATLMGEIAANGATQQDFTNAVTNAMQYTQGQNAQGNAWQPTSQPMQNAPQLNNQITPENWGQFIGKFGSQFPMQATEPSFASQYQPSANQGGRYRLSPGVYGTREQAQRQFESERASIPWELYKTSNRKMY